MEKVDEILIKRALYIIKKGHIIIREYNDDYSRRPCDEKIIDNMKIEIYGENKYHITGLMIKDEFSLYCEEISLDDIEKIDPISLYKVKKKRRLFGIGSEYYQKECGWYSTTERLPLDVTHYGSLTIILSDCRNN